jgi:tripartite-type tricarboxylate transporter receptor subunit TctC
MAMEDMRGGRRALLGWVAGAGLGLPSLALPHLARAQAGWPDRPVRIIIPFPPGGSNDTVARVLQPRLQEILGKPVVVENRGGASGSVGAGEAVRSAPDGYTWALVNDTLAANDTLMQLPYKAQTDFTFCTLVGTCPYALVTQAASPYRTLPQMIEAAKQQPDGLNYATTGTGSLAHISTVLLQSRGGFRMTHVPYRGGGPALQDVLAGHVPLFMSNIVIILPHIRAGLLRPLGVSSARASQYLPDIAPFADQGFPGFEANTYWALVGPAGVPQAITDRQQAAVAQTLQDANVQARMREQGADIVGGKPADCAAFIRAEAEKWGAVIREHQIHPES